MCIQIGEVQAVKCVTLLVLLVELAYIDLMALSRDKIEEQDGYKIRGCYVVDNQPREFLFIGVGMARS